MRYPTVSYAADMGAAERHICGTKESKYQIAMLAHEVAQTTARSPTPRRRMFQAKVDAVTHCMTKVRQLIAHFAGNSKYPASTSMALKLIDDLADERHNWWNRAAFSYCCGIQHYGPLRHTCHHRHHSPSPHAYSKLEPVNRRCTICSNRAVPASSARQCLAGESQSD